MRKCLYVTFAWIFVLLIFILFSCDSKQNKCTLEADTITIQSDSVYSFPIDTMATKMPKRIEEESDNPSISLPQVNKAPEKYSRYYELGYKNGYDDGEEDASNDGGWETSFDDSNHYKGKAKRDYEAGYEEGYHDGYDDNRDIEEDTDPEEYFL